MPAPVASPDPAAVEAPAPDGMSVDVILPPIVQPFATSGALAIVAGGICAAVTGPTGWADGSWVAAFLVLVTGVGQIGLGAGQVMVAATPPPPRRRRAQAGLYNAGSLVVIAGTLSSLPALVSLGCLVVLAALVSFARTARRRDRPPSWPARLYRLLLAVLIVSTPIGVVLTWLRS